MGPKPKLLACLLAVILTIQFLPAMAVADNDFAGGDGTKENPYRIVTPEHLDNVRNYLGGDHADKHFILMTDMDLGVSPWKDGEGWAPMGVAANNFTGSFDGNGYTIRNLTIQRITANYQGLFGYTSSSAVISNLGVEGAQITGNDYVGALAGRSDGTILECHVAGAVSGRNHTGGLAGENRGGVVNSYSAVEVTGSHDYIGGLVGYAPSGIITNAYATGAVTGRSYVGGLVGYGSLTLTHAYSAGAVSGSGSYVGGFLGFGTASACYWDQETSGQETSAGGTGVAGKTTAEMQQQATYVHWNFNTLWTMEEGVSYPVFQDLSQYSLPQPVGLEGLEGSGTPEDPYIITNADELNAIRQDLGAHYRLGNDIDLSSTAIWDKGFGWTPIGDLANHFTGTLDGSSRTIRNLTIHRTLANYQGLFGCTSSSAVITDLGLEDARVNGNNYVAVLAGHSEGSIIKTHATGGLDVTGNDYVGALAGRSGGTILECHAAGAVSGRNFTGGLAGDSRGGVVNSYSAVEVTGSYDYIGGLVGYAPSGIITNAYATGAVTGRNYVGGLVGYGSLTLTHAYSAGAVSGSGSYVGGFLGLGTASACYWDQETSGQETSAGGAGAAGKTTAEMQQQATFSGWDFVDTWSILENSLYPYLQWEKGRPGKLSINIEPEEACIAGAQWSIDGGATWHDSGAILTLGTGPYTVSFKTLDSWHTPPDIPEVEVPEDSYISRIGTYSLKVYTITLIGNPLEGGIVTGGGMYTHGNNVQASASPNPGYYFINWTEGDTVVSTDSNYSFIAEEERTLIANFEVTTSRIAGANRYLTAVEVSKKGWPDGADTVLLARADNFADALAGVPLAFHLDAPILLTATGSLNAATQAEIERLDAKHIILLGGTGAISDSVKEALEEGLMVERIAGDNRYHTAALIAERLREEGAIFDTAFIAVGNNFADALAASSYAATLGQPILLTATNQLPIATKNALNNLEITSTVVCGGEFAIRPEVFNQLPDGRRIAGANRYATAVLLAEEFLPSASKHVTLATGLNFPDAIAGGVLAAKLNTGVLLVRGTDSYPAAVVQDFLDNRGIVAVALFGGSGAISENMEAWFEAYLGQ